MVEKRTLEHYLRRWGPALSAAGIDDSRQELRLLLREALGWDFQKQYLKEKDELPERVWEELEKLAERRSRHEPLSRLFSRADFYGHRFSIAEGGLAPRPETELLVETAQDILEKRPSRELKLAELCCGSGAAGLSLLEVLLRRGTKARLLLSDLDGASLDAARANSQALGLEKACSFERADLLPPSLSAGSLDLILINPPYIPSGDLAGLMPEVRDYEDPRCLDGGSDGLDFYRRIARELPFCLRQGGWIIMEHGSGQRCDLMRLFDVSAERGGFLTREDFAGHDRVLAVQFGVDSDRNK